MGGRRRRRRKKGRKNEGQEKDVLKTEKSYAIRKGQHSRVRTGRCVSRRVVAYLTVDSVRDIRHTVDTKSWKSLERREPCHSCARMTGSRKRSMRLCLQLKQRVVLFKHGLIIAVFSELATTNWYWSSKWYKMFYTRLVLSFHDNVSWHKSVITFSATRHLAAHENFFWKGLG